MIAPMTGATHLGAQEVERLLGLMRPENNTSYYNGSGPVVTDSDRRIGGNSLMMVRDGVGYHSTDYGDLTFDFEAGMSSATVGFAFKFSKKMDAAGVLPILQFQYSPTGEQLSIWIANTGKFMVGTDDFDITNKTEQSTNALRAAETPIGTNLLDWNYLEVSVDYSGTTPAVKIEVNGRVEMDWQVHADFQKQSVAQVDRVSIINPINTHFEDDEYTHYIDDIYITSGPDALGPQHIVWLAPSASVSTETVLNGALSTQRAVMAAPFDKHVTTNYVSNDPEGEGGITEDLFLSGSIDTPVAGITGVQIGVIASNTDVPIDARYGYKYLDETVTFNDEVDTVDPTYYYTLLTGIENGDGFTRSRVNALQIVTGSEV